MSENRTTGRGSSLSDNPNSPALQIFRFLSRPVALPKYSELLYLIDRALKLKVSAVTLKDEQADRIIEQIIRDLSIFDTADIGAAKPTRAVWNDEQQLGIFR